MTRMVQSYLPRIGNDAGHFLLTGSPHQGALWSAAMTAAPPSTLASASNAKHQAAGLSLRSQLVFICRIQAPGQSRWPVALFSSTSHDQIVLARFCCVSGLLPCGCCIHSAA